MARENSKSKNEVSLEDSYFVQVEMMVTSFRVVMVMVVISVIKMEKSERIWNRFWRRINKKVLMN